MDSLLTRYRNTTILVAVLFAQVLGLAVQVRRPTESGSTRLIRVWVATAFTPVEKAILGVGRGLSDLWHDYLWLRGVRRENEELREQIGRMRLEQVRLGEDAAQARRLQALLDFKEEHITGVVAAQVVGSSGTETSRLLYLDKGSRDGLRPDLPVITADGIVGKLVRVFPLSSQVLVINDGSSGVGAMLEKSRLQGVLKGTPAGEVVLHYVMSDEKVQPGELVLTSGGDRVFPKGLPVGRVIDSSPGQDLFLNIRVKPAATINRLEEVLVITRVEHKAAQPGEMTGPLRASDILGQRLPAVPQSAKTSAPTAAPAGAAKPDAEKNKFAPPPPMSQILAAQPRPKPADKQTSGQETAEKPVTAPAPATPPAQDPPEAPRKAGTAGDAARPPR